MSTKEKKRPTSLAEWEKTDLVPTSAEMTAERKRIKKHHLDEQARLAHNREMRLQKICEDYNLDPETLRNELNQERELAGLNQAIVAGDAHASLRLKEILDGIKVFNEYETKFDQSRENLRARYIEERTRINMIDKRRQEVVRKKLQKNIDALKASKENVDHLETRINQMEQLREPLVKYSTFQRKIELHSAQIRALQDQRDVFEQELFKIKEILKLKGLDR